MRIVLALCFVLASLPSLTQGTRAQSLTAGQLVLLGASGPVAAETLRTALASPDAGVRSVAARLAANYVVVDVRGELEAALTKEADPDAGAELVRALLFFGRDEAIPALEPHARRIGVEARMPIFEWRARTNPAAFADGLPALVQDLGRADAARIAPLARMVAALLDRPELERMFTVRPGGSVVPGVMLLSGDLPVTARLLPMWRAGLLTSAADAASCPLENARFGHARLTLRPDGRPSQVAVDPTDVPEACIPVLAGLARLTLADADRPLPEDRIQWVVLPFTERYADCAPSQQQFFEGEAPQSVAPPKKQKDVRPTYPARMIQKQIQGTVIIDATISDAGCIPNGRVLMSPALELSLAALRAVSQWEYAPATREGTAMAVAMTLTVRFSLRR